MSLAIKQQLNAIFGPAGESLLTVVHLAKEEVVGARDRDVTRLLCLTAKRNGKAKLHKVKSTPPSGAFAISKTWVLADLQILEVIDKSSFVTVFNKPHTWQAKDTQARDDFLMTLLKLTKKHPPKLINVESNLIKQSNYDLGPAVAVAASASAAPDEKLQQEQPGSTWRLDSGNELVDVEELLKTFNWKSTNNAAALEQKLQSDLAQIESENIYGMIESTKRTQLVATQIDKTLQRLDAMSGWLSVYMRDLSRISKQVTFIQERHRSIHAQTENQEALKAEMARFLGSLALPPQVEDTLRGESLDNPSGLARVEAASAALRKAMENQADPDLRSMAVVVDQAGRLKIMCAAFVKRLTDHFLRVCGAVADACLADRSRPARRGNLRLAGLYELEDAVAKYRALLAWLRDTDAAAYKAAMAHYVLTAGKVYRAEIHELFDVLRTHHLARGGAGGGSADDAEYLFTAQSLVAQTANAAAGLSKNLAGGSKAALAGIGAGARGHGRKPSQATAGSPVSKLSMGRAGESSGNLTLAGEDKMELATALQQVFGLVVPVVMREQSFFAVLFHLHASDPVQFQGARWQDAQLADVVLGQHADVVKDMVGSMFDGLLHELTGLTEGGAGSRDASAASLAMLNVVEKQLAKTPPAQAFLVDLLNTLQIRLKSAWTRFLDSQMRGVQEHKHSKKKGGLLSIVRIYPRFLEHMEETVESPPESVRTLLDHAYDQLLKLVIQTLELMASVEEDVLMLENALYLHGELRGYNVPAIEEHKFRLETQSAKALAQYVAHVLRKAFGKLYDWQAGLDSLLATQAPDEIVYQNAYNRATARKLLGGYGARDVAKCVEHCHRKVHKNIGDPGVAARVWAQTVADLEAFQDRLAKNCKQVYGDAAILEFSLSDIQNACAAAAK